MDSKKEVEACQSPEECPICSKVSIKACSACHAVSYCSVDHQKLDWKSHKTNCKAFIIKENEELGRHAVAARDLKEGTVILKETAVASAPATAFFTHGVGNFCLGCCCLMATSDNPNGKCSKCKWPVCSQACENFENHSENECKIFAERGVPVFSTDNQDILILRTCLLKQKHSTHWEALKNLQSEPGYNSNCDLVKIEEKVKSFGVSDIVTVGDWTRISKMCSINAYSKRITPILRKGQPERLIQSVFLTIEGSHFAHSCAPNCIRNSSLPPHIKMFVRTAVKIKKGEALTIAYFVDRNMTGTHKRQATSPFPCKCLRCKDPLELGSNLSTWVCQKCKQPSLVTTDPLDVNAIWKCISCGQVDIFGSLKISQMDSLYKIVEDAELTEKDIKKLMKMITKYSGTNLHPNHWILQEATRKALQFTGNQRIIRKLTRDESNFYISSCYYLLAVADKIVPGISLERSQLKAFIAQEKINNTVDDFNAKILTAQLCREELVTIKDLYEDAYKFYKLDSTDELNNEKGQIALDIEEDINNITCQLLRLDNIS